MQQEDVINIDRIWLRPPVPQPLVYDIYLSGYLDEAQYYQKELHLIRNLDENEEIHLHLNGPGGIVSTAVQFIKAMRESKGLIVCYAEGECSSAYTFIFLAGHGFDVAEHNTFLCHNYSSGLAGKGNEIMKQAEMLKGWSRELIQDYYRGFLDQEEMDELLDDRDIWLTREEVLERCQKMVNMHEAEHKAELAKQQEGEQEKAKKSNVPTEKSLLKGLTPETAHADLVQNVPEQGCRDYQPAALYSRIVCDIGICFSGTKEEFQAEPYEGIYKLESPNGHYLGWYKDSWEMEGFDDNLHAFKFFLYVLNIPFASDISESYGAKLLLDVAYELLEDETKKTP